MVPCPTCKTMVEDFCMCGKCPNCDPEHFKPRVIPDDDGITSAAGPNDLSTEIRSIAEGIIAGEAGEVEF